MECLGHISLQSVSGQVNYQLSPPDMEARTSGLDCAAHREPTRIRDDQLWWGKGAIGGLCSFEVAKVEVHNKMSK